MTAELWLFLFSCPVYVRFDSLHSSSSRWSLLSFSQLVAILFSCVVFVHFKCESAFWSSLISRFLQKTKQTYPSTSACFYLFLFSLFAWNQEDWWSLHSESTLFLPPGLWACACARVCVYYTAVLNTVAGLEDCLQCLCQKTLQLDEGLPCQNDSRHGTMALKLQGFFFADWMFGAWMRYRKLERYYGRVNEKNIWYFW